MGLELPSELTEPLSWIGLIWPEADEEKLFEAGQAWFSFGQTLRPIIENADAGVKPVWSAAKSGDDAAVNAFEHWWNDKDGPTVRLADDALAAEIIGGALVVFAGITLALKIAFIAQLIALAIEVAQAIATAFATFGATTAEIPGWIALTRGVCRTLIKQVVTHVQTIIRDLLQKARNLFKKIGSREAHRLEHEAFKLKNLERDYVGENDPLHGNFPFGPNKVVHYFDDAERAEARLFVKDGKLFDATGRPFDTAAGVSVHSPGQGRAIFVMDKDGNIFASNYQEIGKMHHSSLLGGQPVAGAGELAVENGTLKVITNNSGHYRPPTEYTEQVLRWLEQQGVDISGVVRGGF
ncbi:MAG: hypothetical protein ABI808_05990 [Pseudonocardiales bacterium]